MSLEEVRKYFPILKKLGAAKTKKKKLAILKKHGWPLLRSLCACCYNVRENDYPIKDKKTFLALRRNRKRIEKLSNKKVKRTEKKKIVLQSGGFIGPLLSVLAPVIGAITGALT